MYDDLPIAQKIGQICDVAREAEINKPSAIIAQDFFKTAGMGITDSALLGCHPTKKHEGQALASLQSKFMEVAARVVSHLNNGMEFQTGTDYETLLAAIPETEPGIRYTVDKVALHMGLRPARR